MFKFFMFFYKPFLYPDCRAIFTKKKLLKSLSIPITSNPFLQKKSTDSDPTNPDEPVIIIIDIKKI